MLAAMPSWSDFARQRDESRCFKPWDRLAGLWSPELGPSGSRFFDCSGQMRHAAAYNNPTWTVGRNGWMLGFSAGLSQYVDCGVIPEFDSSQHATIGTWLEIGNGTNISVGMPGTYAQRFEIFCDSSTIYFTIDSAYPYASCNYGLNHFAMVFDATLGTKAIRGYINGRLAAEGAGPANTAPIEQLGAFYLGLGSGGRYSTGRIGVTAVFGRSLHPDEVAQLYVDPLGLLRPRRRKRLGYLGAVGGSYHLAAARTFHTGATAGQIFNTGQSAGMVDG
jgi:hypothetical protein